jgi:sRNA-binding carbon storage regulator CsrA
VANAAAVVVVRNIQSSVKAVFNAPKAGAVARSEIPVLTVRRWAENCSVILLKRL